MTRLSVTDPKVTVQGAVAENNPEVMNYSTWWLSSDYYSDAKDTYPSGDLKLTVHAHVYMYVYHVCSFIFYCYDRKDLGSF